jgi:hypothetical protein
MNGYLATGKVGLKGMRVAIGAGRCGYPVLTTKAERSVSEAKRWFGTCSHIVVAKNREPVSYMMLNDLRL